jgi:hypothetical protein
MPQISFRQGIVRRPSGTWLSFNGSNANESIILDTSTAPLLLNFADAGSDYLWEENQSAIDAWGTIPSSGNPDISLGPLPSAGQYWLYIDIDALTGERKFGTTIYDPVSQSSPPSNPKTDQHWFDTRVSSSDGTYMTQKVWNGHRWISKIRIFVGEVNGLSISQGTVGTQVGINITVRAGRILFDDENKTRPIKKFDIRGRGKFVTTETTIFSQFSNISGYRLAQSIVEGKAIENIAQYHAITFRGSRRIGLAKNGEDQMSLDSGPYEAIGISTEDYVTGEVFTFVSSGYLTDDNVMFSAPAGTKVFVGENGELVTEPPQIISIQQIGTVVDENTIFVDIGPIIFYQNA